MKTIPTWAEKLLRRELKFVAEGMEFDREAAQKILPLLAPRRKNEKQKATAKRKLQGAAARRAASADVRAAVMDRARAENGTFLCEGRGCLAAMSWLEFDHWLGGVGRKRQREAIETTWALCSMCHRDRTDNEPDAAYWNDLFARHCAKYGYPVVQHVEHARLPRRAS